MTKLTKYIAAISAFQVLLLILVWILVPKTENILSTGPEYRTASIIISAIVVLFLVAMATNGWLVIKEMHRPGQKKINWLPLVLISFVFAFLVFVIYATQPTCGCGA